MAIFVFEPDTSVRELSILVNPASNTVCHLFQTFRDTIIIADTNHEWFSDEIGIDESCFGVRGQVTGMYEKDNGSRLPECAAIPS